MNIIHYTLYELLRPSFDDTFGSFGPGIAGVVAKCSAVIATSPLEKFKTMLMGTGSGTFTLSYSGFSGLKATLIRDAIFSGVFFFTMENLHQNFKEKNEHLSRILSCTAAATLAAVLTHPFDVVKTKLQTRFCCYGHLEKIPFSAVKVIQKSEGMKSLTIGI